MRSLMAVRGPQNRSVGDRRANSKQMLCRRGAELFKAKFLVLLQERDGFAQPPLPRLLLLSEHDPSDVVPTIGRRQA